MKSSGLLLRWAICLVFGAAVGCAPRPRNASPASGAHELELVESSPVETVLDHPDIPDAKNVWPAMIAAASHSIDFAEFYASNQPGSSLEGVIQAIEKAASRGVRVRFLSEKKFYQTYPETLDRLATRNGIEVRRYPGAELAGGVLHAKYFMVDGREAFVGSQNFDWRSLEHIQELGVRVCITVKINPDQTHPDNSGPDWDFAVPSEECSFQSRAFQSRSPSGSGTRLRACRQWARRAH